MPSFLSFEIVSATSCLSSLIQMDQILLSTISRCSRLSRIFHARCCQLYLRKDHDFALAVSQVSRYKNPFPAEWRRVPEISRTSYSRSYSHPLHIGTTLSENDDPKNIKRRKNMRALFRGYLSPPFDDLLETDHCLHTQLDIIIPEVSRWCSFTFQCDDPDVVWEATKCLAYLSAPILESFGIVPTYTT